MPKQIYYNMMGEKMLKIQIILTIFFNIVCLVAAVRPLTLFNQQTAEFADRV